MDNFLLVFFALPVAISILSAVFETILHSPIKIAGITFSILLIATFAAFDESFLIFTILYTLLSFIVSWLTRQWCHSQCNHNNNELVDSNETFAKNKTIDELIKQSSLNNTYQDSDYTRYRRR